MAQTVETIDSKEKNRIIFEDLPIPKALMTLAVPTIMAQLVVLVYNLADTFFIGRTNNPLMVAGASLILPYFNVAVAFAGLAGVGGGTLISRLLGAGRPEEAKKVSMFSFWIGIVLAGIFAALTFLFMDPIMRLLGAGPDTLLYAKQYAFCVIVIGGIPTIMQMTMANLIRSIGSAKQSGFGVSMGGCINMLLDPLFMFVIFPKGMETAAAGIATMVSNVIVCIYFGIVIYRLRGQSVLTFRPSVGLPERDSILSIFTVGIPSACATLLFDLDYMVIDRLAAGHGDIPLAAIGIVLKAERLPLNVGVGLCQGMMPIAAYNYSAKNLDRMKKAVSFSRLVGLGIGILSIVLYQLFAGQIMHIFINDPETVRIGTNFLRVRVLATPLMFMCFHLVNFFQAVGRGDRALFLAVVRWVVFNIPMLFLLHTLFGMYGIVWAQITADIGTVAVSFYVYYKFKQQLR